MSEELSTEARKLGEIGFVHPVRAMRDLRAVEEWYPPSAAAALVARCAASIDPDAALAAVERLVAQRRWDGLSPPPDRTFEVIVTLSGYSYTSSQYG